MKQIKMAILQTEWEIWNTLKTYSKMTPGGKGVWKNLVGVPTIEEADLAVIIDYTIYDLPKDMPKVYLGAHPPECVGYRCYDDKEAVVKFDLRDTFGFGEWWIEWNYDTLMELKNPIKTNKLSCILSNKTSMEEHKSRREIANRVCKEYPGILDVYGRIVPNEDEADLKKHYKGVLGIKNPSIIMDNGKHLWGKIPALLSYKYSLEFDYFCQCENYFSERVFDALLLWTFPIYSGGKGIGKYLPKNSFYPIDSQTVTAKEIVDVTNSNLREDNIKNIKIARELILNKYQLWARVYEGIKGKL